MTKIPCPSCREPNFDTDIVCWKCGEPLEKQDGPDVYQLRHTVQIDIHGTPASDGVADSPVPPSIPELVIAMLIGVLVGALVSLLVNVPFLLWIKASYTPYPEAMPFLRWMVAAGAAAGAASVTGRYGVIAGFLVYEAAYVAILGYTSLRPITMPPSLNLFTRRDPHGFYYPVAGLICSYVALVTARLAFRCVGHKVRLAAQPSSVSYVEHEQLDALRVVALLSLLAFAFDLFRYLQVIHRAAGTPEAVVMGYCQAMVSSPSGNLSRAEPFLSRAFAARVSSDASVRSAMNPRSVFSSPEVADQIAQRRARPLVAETDPVHRTTTVEITFRGSAMPKAHGMKSITGPTHLVFELSGWKGNWRISQPPRFWQESP